MEGVQGAATGVGWGRLGKKEVGGRLRVLGLGQLSVLIFDTDWGFLEGGLQDHE